MFVALINVSGDPLYQEFRKQEVLVKILTTMGEKVQAAKDKEVSTKKKSLRWKSYESVYNYKVLVIRTFQ